MISIVLASYNGEKYIRQQLDSIFAQTVQDFELIISDDCSTDKTCGIVQEYIARKSDMHGQSRIKLYRSGVNNGFKKNFETALSYASGDYIALCDQDDIWHPNHLELLLSCIGNGLLCCGNAELVDAQGNSLNKTLFETYGSLNVLSSSHDVLIRLLYKPNPFQGASMLFKRSFLETALPIPESVPFHDTWFALLSAAMNSFSFTVQSVTQYRRHEQQITKRVDKPFSLKYNVMSIRKEYAQNAAERTGSADCLRAVDYYAHVHTRSFRFSFLLFWISHYRTIFLTKSYIRLPARLFKFLFF